MRGSRKIPRGEGARGIILFAGLEGGRGPMPTNFFCWYIFYVYLISFNFPWGERGGGGLGPEAPTFRSAQVYVLSHFRISNKLIHVNERKLIF